MQKVNWHQADCTLKLLANEVHLWKVNLAVSSTQIVQLIATLSKDEQERVNKFKFDQHRQRFIAARGFLREILSKYLDIDSQDIVFNYSDRGKPKLENNYLQFNISHSQNLALYALTLNKLIGIDVEYLRSNVECDKISQRFFTPQESQLINSLNPQQQVITFFHFWTIKEAYLKATGEGLAGGLETVEIKYNSNLEATVTTINARPTEAKNWFFSSFIPQDDFIATVAIYNQQQPLIIKQFTLN